MMKDVEQCNNQMIYYKIVYLKPIILLTNATSINPIKIKALRQHNINNNIND